MKSKNGFSIQIESSFSNFPKTRMIGGHTYVPLKHNSNYKIILKNNRSVKCDAQVFVDGKSVGVFRIPAHNFLDLERPSKVDKKFTFVKEQSHEAKQGGVLSGKQENGIVKVIFFPEYEFSNWDSDSVSLTGSSLADLNFLSGIDTVGQTLRNSNRQLRSEPPNPKTRVNPWLQSTIEPDRYRKPLEISGDTIGYPNRVHSNSIQPQSNFSNNFSSGATVLKNKSNQQFQNTSQIQNIDKSLVTKLSLRLIVDNYNKHFGGHNADPPRIENMMRYDQISAL